MLRTVSICLWAMVFVHTSYALPLTNSQEVDVKLVREFSDSRDRREIRDSNLPDELDFQVSGKSGAGFGLRLKRSPLIPAVTSDGWSSSGQSAGNAGVYTDLASGAAVIVKGESGNYQLTGTINKEGTTYDLKPKQALDANSHVISLPDLAEHEVIYGHDSVKDDKGELPQVIDILGSPNGRGGARRKRAALNQGDTLWAGWEELSRNRRNAVLNTVEIAMVVDNSDYNNWVSLVGASNAVNEMTLWYTYVAESIRIRYESIVDADIAMTTRVIQLRILTNPADDDILGDLVSDGVFPSNQALTAFSNWAEAQTQQNQLPVSDHYMMFSRYKPQGATGVAFAGRVCTFLGVSITQNTLEGNLGGIAAHELGHSLNAKHDVDTGGVCTDDDKFVMSAVFVSPVASPGNPWKFSPCSISAFKSYLNTKTCTLPENTNGNDELPAPAPGSRAGEVLNRDEQCRLFFENPSSAFCESLQIHITGTIESVCGGMFCSNPDGSGYCTYMIPQEYTTCNDNKWCKAGFCVDIETTTTPAPETTTTPAPETTTTPAPETTTTPAPETTTTPAPETTTTPAPETTTTPAPETTTTPAPETTTTPAPETTTTPAPETTTTPAPETTTTPAPETTTTPAPETTTTPAPETTTTPAETTTPAPETTTTPAETTTPAPETTTPAAETTTPAAETTTPAEETTTPAEETTTPAAETTTPAAETTTPAAETTTPAAETTTPAAETTSPAAETTTPAAETTTPAAETTTPAAETTTPAAETTTPAAETTRSAEETTTPAEETTTPAAETTRPAEETTTPAEETTTPAVETTTSVADTTTEDPRPTSINECLEQRGNRRGREAFAEFIQCIRDFVARRREESQRQIQEEQERRRERQREEERRRKEEQRRRKQEQKEQRQNRQRAQRRRGWSSRQS